jgi:hypothetical protein
MSALEEIAAERLRQVHVEGWAADHDDEHRGGAMAAAASCYAMAAHWWQNGWNPIGLTDRMAWPWARRWWKPRNPREDLIRAGALIVAEIERLDRSTAAER